MPPTETLRSIDVKEKGESVLERWEEIPEEMRSHWCCRRRQSEIGP